MQMSKCANFRMLGKNHLHILASAYLDIYSSRHLIALSISRLPGAPGAFSTLNPSDLSMRFRFPVMA
jgi:hypothetical protein